MVLIVYSSGIAKKTKEFATDDVAPNEKTTPHWCSQTSWNAKMDKVIRERIPSGFAVRDTAHALAEEIDLSALRWKKGLNIDQAYRSIGTLGGGNHFIEVNKGEDGALYLVVHSGSRHLGLEIVNDYQAAGYEHSPFRLMAPQ